MFNPHSRESQIIGSLWGAVCGDALGVPVEFESRTTREADPVTGMRSGGAHGQPEGTWSDDTSMILCTIESLLERPEVDTRDLAERFRRWLRQAHWTPRGEVFDIGIATRQAIARFAEGKPPERCGGRQEYENGNGSLMRILPVSLWHHKAGKVTALEATHRVSQVTHGHPRSQMVCGYFTLMVRAIWETESVKQALEEAWRQAATYYPHQEEFQSEWPLLSRLNPEVLANLQPSDIQSSGYCIHTLEASLWCLLQSLNYRHAVLTAVNLGEDTDTTACVTGALAGLAYGITKVPLEWIEPLARGEELAPLFQDFATAVLTMR